MDSNIGYKFEFTNQCSCTYYDEDTDSYLEMDYCDGHCWDDAIADFEIITEKLFDDNETYWWKVSNLKLWDGNHSGYFFAKNAAELIKGMTVDSAWTLSGEICDGYIKYSVSHHDAPWGSNTTLEPVSDEQREFLGLY